jgi:AGZA family xanthine/uracil permease-like MFS transporter
MAFAWHVGALILVAIGVFKTIVAPVGNAVRRWVPRAGLLGSLAAIALVLIAFLPLLNDVAAVPVVGLLALLVILVTLVARRPLPGKIPGALAAVVLGVAVYFLCREIGTATGWPLVPPGHGSLSTGAPPAPLSDQFWNGAWWEEVARFALAQLPLILPFGLATIVGGIDCTESAAAVGDEYDTTQVLMTEGLASVAAGLCGGVIQNTPYIGQPAYKAMGGRAAYTLATALFIGAAGFFGWFTHLFDWLPRPALFPILIFVGLEITAQSFHATPSQHYPALALAAMPALAYVVLIEVDAALAGRPPVSPDAAATQQTLRCLGNGFIVTSLLWAAALAALIDGRLVRSAGYLIVAAVCSLVGIIHSPLQDPQIAWPTMLDLPESARFQTPYHWAGTYAACAVLLIALSVIGTRRADPEKSEKTEDAPESSPQRP